MWIFVIYSHGKERKPLSTGPCENIVSRFYGNRALTISKRFQRPCLPILWPGLNFNLLHVGNASRSQQYPSISDFTILGRSLGVSSLLKWSQERAVGVESWRTACACLWQSKQSLLLENIWDLGVTCKLCIGCNRLQGGVRIKAVWSVQSGIAHFVYFSHSLASLKAAM